MSSLAIIRFPCNSIKFWKDKLYFCSSQGHYFALAHQELNIVKISTSVISILSFLNKLSALYTWGPNLRVFFRWNGLTATFQNLDINFIIRRREKLIFKFVYYKTIWWYFWAFNLECKMKTKPSNIELQNISNFQDWFPLELLKDLSFPNTFKELPTRVIGWPWYWQDLPISN